MKSSSVQTTSNLSQRLPASTRVAIVVSSYHDLITEKMLDAARATLAAAGMTKKQIEIIRVPGAWEIPLAAKWISESKKFAAIITLGAVIKGDTSHDQHINRFVSLSLGQLGLATGIPVTFGVLTCNNLSQARERSGGKLGNKGSEAAQAALAMLHLRRTISN
jgi:6,7-dimethyl-8-ribityllumazine synthase